MASIAHVAVGMAAGRIHSGDSAPSWLSMFGWSALALLPDVDVIGFMMGVPYAAPWGHRGATHSLAFALGVAAAVGFTARQSHRQPLRTWFIACLVLVSHSLLDTLTDGGLGCALLWPFDRTRFFAPWRPILVAPIGLALLSPYGFLVATSELVLFAPLIVFAAGPERVPWALLPVWLVGAWLVASGDSLRQATLGIVLREHTEYARGFSEQAFGKIKIGQSSEDVRQLIGSPLGEWWDYTSEQPTAVAGCPWIYLEADRVAVDRRARESATARCSDLGIHSGMSRADAQRALGPPRDVCWRYTRSTEAGFHRARTVCFAGGKVVAVVRRWQSG